MAITAAQLNVRIGTEGADRAKREIAGVGDAVDQAESRRRMLGTGLLGMGGVITGLFAGGAVAAIDFGEQMANVNSIAQLTTSELSALSDQVLEMSTTTGQSATTLASGLYDIASSGFVGAEGLMVLEASATAATAGMTTTEVAAKGVTAVLNAYGLAAEDAAHVSDVMFQTVNEGVITFEQLSANMGNTLPLANALGISFEELGAGYAIMTKNGVGASQTETQLAALMRAAINPTTELTAAVQSYGYASVEALIAAEGLPGFLNLLTEASGGTTEGLFELLGTAEATNAALLLGGENADEYAASLERMKASSEGLGATQTALNKQMESTSFSLRLLKTNIQAAAIAIGVQLEPGIRFVAKAMTAMIKIFLDLPKPIQRVIGIITALTGAIALVAGGIILFGSQIAAIAGLFVSLLGPILLIGGAIAGLYLAWRTNFMGIRDITEDAFGAVLDFLDPVLDFVDRFKEAWDSLGQSVDDAVTGPLDAFTAGLGALGLGADETVGKISFLERAIAALDIATGGMVSRLREMSFGDIVIAIGGWAFSAATDAATSLYNWLAPQIVNIAQDIPGVALNIVSWVVTSAVSIWDAITNFAFGYGADSGMSGDGTGGATPGQSITIGEIAVNIGGWIAGEIADITTWLVDQLPDDWSAVGNAARDKFAAALSAAFSSGQDIGAGLGSIGPGIIDSITQAIAGVDWNNAGAVAAQMFINALKAAFGMMSLGPTFIAGITDGLAGADWSSIAVSIKDFIVAAISAQQGFAQGFGETLFSELSQAMANVDWGSLASTIATSLGSAISGAVGFAAEIGGKLNDELAQAMANVDWGSLAATIGEKMVAAVVGVGQSVGQAIVDEIQGVISAWTPSWPDLNPFDSGGDTTAAFASFDFTGVLQGLRDVKAELAGGFDTSALVGGLETVKASLSELQGLLGGGLAGAKEQLAGMITITVDNSAALQSIDEVSAAMATINGLTSTVRLAGDNGAALAAIRDVESSMGGIDGMTSTIYIVGDNSDAMAAIREVAAYDGRSLGSATFSVHTITTSSPVAVGRGIGSGVLKGWDQATGTRSPSTEMIKRGEYLFQGLDIGWTGSANNLPIGFDVPSPTVPLQAGGGLRGGGGRPVTVNVNVPTTINMPEHVSDAEMQRIFQVYAKAQELATRTALQAEGVAA